MKKIIAFVVCTILLVCALTVSTFAEGESIGGIDTNVGAVTTNHTEVETATEGGNSVGTATPKVTTELIKEWIKEHWEEISVVCSLIFSAFYTIRKHRQLNRSIAATNQNAIAVSENSDLAISNSLNMMAEYKKTIDEEKKRLEQMLNEAMTYIKASKLANIEFANELAELLVLANIPNAKKDELYSRHIAAVKTISEAEKTEVNTDDDGKET